MQKTAAGGASRLARIQKRCGGQRGSRRSSGRCSRTRDTEEPYKLAQLRRPVEDSVRAPQRRAATNCGFKLRFRGAHKIWSRCVRPSCYVARAKARKARAVDKESTSEPRTDSADGVNSRHLHFLLDLQLFLQDLPSERSPLLVSFVLLQYFALLDAPVFQGFSPYMRRENKFIRIISFSMLKWRWLLWWVRSVVSI